MSQSNTPAVLDAKGEPMRRSAGAEAFQGASQVSQSLSSWDPALRDADSAHRFARDPLVSRARDLQRNSPVARSGLEGDLSRVVGANWRLRVKPRHDLLGITRAEARALGRRMEAELWLWANDPHRRCDVRRRLSFAQIRRLARRQKRVDGETLAVMRFKPDGGRYATCVQMISTDRLMNRDRAQDSPVLRSGVHLSPDGAPIAYDILNAHPNDFYTAGDNRTWITVPRLSETGRPVVIHAFRDEEVDQHRGVTPFAPVLKLFRLTDRYMEAEVASAIIGATIGAFVKSGFDPATVAESLSVSSAADAGKGWQDHRVDYYRDNPVKFNDVRLPVIMPGDDIVLTNAARDTSPFDGFAKTAFQMSSAALGNIYPEISQNWEGLNFTTLRGAYNMLWDRVAVERSEDKTDFVDPIVYCVIEEGMARGYYDDVMVPGMPDFHDLPAAYLNYEMIGPGQKHLDPVKGTQASLMALDGNLTTLERECADLGLDYEEVLEQRAFERALISELGLPDHDTEAALSVQAPSDLETAPAAPAAPSNG